jgi:signal transduction histidine kinase
VEPPRDASKPGLLGAYRLERARLLARRVPVAATFFVLSIGIAAAFDWSAHPERRPALLLVFGSQVAAAVAAAWSCGWSFLRPWTVTITTVFACVLGLLATGYFVVVGAPLEQLTVTHVCLLAGASVLLPWTWRAQTAMSICFAAAFLLAAPALQGSVDPLVLGLPVVVLGALTVSASYHLDHYRREAFLTSARHADEARTSAALAHVGDTLHAHLHGPDMLARLVTLATEQLDCDWSAVYLRDVGADRFQLRALSGPVSEAERAQLGEFEFDRERLPLLAAMDHEDLVEVTDAARETRIPPEMTRRFRIASALYTPIRGRDGVTGTLVHGYLRRIGPFTPQQRRLAVGMAQVAAIAIENARLIDQLAAASRLKSEFVATMSHELRTPLNVITGYTDLLEEGLFGTLTPEQYDTVDRIRQSAFALLELVSMTLDLGRLENGREPVTLGTVDVDEVLDDLRRETAPLVASGVTLGWTVPSGLTIESDRGKLKTIVKNLVGNALKFTRRGHVDVEVAWREETLHVVVRDTGIGIARENLSVIFEMFRQVDGSSTRRFEGVGLGLHIVQRFTELLDGAVTAESTVGEGSTFRVAIPCTRVAAARRA